MSPEETERINGAIWSWLSAREIQGHRSQELGNAQGGRRAQVTAGAHMKGVDQLIQDEIRATGATGLELRKNRDATLAGWYRSSKAWDLLVLQHGQPVLAVEYKSMGSSIGNNLNNRADEVIGCAEDARQAEAHGVLPPNLRRAYIYVLEVSPPPPPR